MLAVAAAAIAPVNAVYLLSTKQSVVLEEIKNATSQTITQVSAKPKSKPTHRSKPKSKSNSPLSHDRVPCRCKSRHDKIH